MNFINHKYFLNFLKYSIIIWCSFLFIFPIYLSISAIGTSTSHLISNTHVPLLSDGLFFANLNKYLNQSISSNESITIGGLLLNSFIMATGIAVLKIAFSIIAAYVIVYFKFPFRKLAFIVIFASLMLPLEIRILSTYQIISDFKMLNTYSGLIVPITASATATFLFKQFFLTVPDELFEAARIDNAGPFKFLYTILLPLSKNNILAIFIIMFVYGWNQYLWPLIASDDARYYTITMYLNRLAVVDNGTYPEWDKIMLTNLFSMIPPIIIIIAMKKQFVQGLMNKGDK